MTNLPPGVTDADPYFLPPEFAKTTTLATPVTTSVWTTTGRTNEQGN